MTWSLRALVDLVTDAPSPITVDGLRILDPEGTVVLDVPHLEARVKLRTLIGGSFSIHDLRVAQGVLALRADGATSRASGSWRRWRPRTPPPPAAAARRRQPGPGSFFQIVNAELGDLNAVFDFPGRLGARAAAHARHGVADPVGGRPDAPDLRLRRRAGGRRGRRLAAHPGRQPAAVRSGRRSTASRRRRSAPTTSSWTCEGAETGPSQLVGKGFFTGIYGATSVPGIDLHGALRRRGRRAGRGGGRQEDRRAQPSAAHGASVRARSHAARSPSSRSRRASAASTSAFDDYRALRLGFDLGFDAGAGQVDVTKLPARARRAAGAWTSTRSCNDTLKLALDARPAPTCAPTATCRPRCAPMAGGPPRRAHRRARRSGAKSVDATRPRLRAAPRARRGAAARRCASTATPTCRRRTSTRSGLTVEIPGASATAKGADRSRRQLVRAGARRSSPSTSARVLGELGLPPLAKDARHRGERPAAASTAPAGHRRGRRSTGSARGARSLPELKARFSLRDGVARIDALSGAAFERELHANGELRLYEKTRATCCARREVDAAGRGARPESGDDPGRGRRGRPAVVHGRRARAARRGRPPSCTSRPARASTVLGDALRHRPGRPGARRRAASRSSRLHLARAGGGALDVAGHVGAGAAGPGRRRRRSTKPAARGDAGAGRRRGRRPLSRAA